VSVCVSHTHIEKRVTYTHSLLSRRSSSISNKFPTPAITQPAHIYLIKGAPFSYRSGGTIYYVRARRSNLERSRAITGAMFGEKLVLGAPNVTRRRRNETVNLPHYYYIAHRPCSRANRITQRRSIIEPFKM